MAARIRAFVVRLTLITLVAMPTLVTAAMTMGGL